MWSNKYAEKYISVIKSRAMGAWKKLPGKKAYNPFGELNRSQGKC